MKTVLGIGNALVDMLISLEDDEPLAKLELEKGSMTLVDRDKMNNVLSHTESLRLPKKPQKSAGGSVANTIHGLAQLGAPAGYIGKIGVDDYGSFFRSYMEQNNICTSLIPGKVDTGKCIVLISPDSERTFATYLGAAVELEAGDLTIEPFRGYDYFHLEGYLVQNHALVEAAVKLAHEVKCVTSIDLASFNIVAENLEFLQAIVAQYVDIVFANEEEARAFTGKEDPEAALRDIAGTCKIAVVKTGKEGSLIETGGKISRVAAIDANPVDTTGAGDLYAAGFFFGLVNGQPMDVCGKIGSVTAGKSVEVVGAKMDAARWQLIRRAIDEKM